MTVQHAWVIPDDPQDMAPLPALIKDGRISFYNRRENTFGAYLMSLEVAYPSFDECRAAMIDMRIDALDQAREHARKLANSVEHIRTIPAASFPDVLREVSEAEQQQEGEGQEEAKAEEVKPALKRPRRNG